MNEAAQQISRMPDELRELVDAACNGTISPAQSNQLEALLRDDDTVRLSYLAYLDVHAQLQWEGRSGAAPAAGEPSERTALLAADADGQTTPLPACPTTPPRRGGRLWWTTVAAVAAAILVLAVAGLRQSWLPKPDPAPQHVAVWTGSFDAGWQRSLDSTDTPTPRPGDPLDVGTYHLLRGLAEIRFLNGATIVCEGPMEIELIDRSTAGLRAGRLVAVVPPDAVGFTVRTPTAEIVDRGTEFGIGVDIHGNTLVQVFEGRVEGQSVVSESDLAGVVRRIWPLTALRIAAEPSTSDRGVPFEPRRFVRRRPDAPLEQLEVAAIPLVTLDHDANATAHVKSIAASLETAPATALQLRSIFEGFSEINDLTHSELSALIPALVEMLADRRLLAVEPGASNSPVRQRVCDRADLALAFIAGRRPSGDDRQQAWTNWWSTAQDASRTAWFAERHDAFAQALVGWQAGSPYEAKLDAAKAVEIAARSDDSTVLPFLVKVLTEELPRAHQTELSLAIILDAIGQLGGPQLVPELVELAKQVNQQQAAVTPHAYSIAHARRSDAVRAFAVALDRLAGTALGDDALTPIGSPIYQMCMIDDAAFGQWLEAAKRRAGDLTPRSPSDLPEADDDKVTTDGEPR